MKLTQKELKRLLHYDPETGIFTRLVSSSNRVKVGDVAGTIKEGYITIMVDGRIYCAHRLAWLYAHGEWPENEVDHINHIRDDNRLINLREATHQENTKNATLRKDNTSGVIGVYRHKLTNKWQASISVNGKLTHLGIFHKKGDAIKTRKEAENKHGYHANHGAESNDIYQ